MGSVARGSLALFISLAGCTAANPLFDASTQMGGRTGGETERDPSATESGSTATTQPRPTGSASGTSTRGSTSAPPPGTTTDPETDPTVRPPPPLTSTGLASTGCAVEPQALPVMEDTFLVLEGGDPLTAQSNYGGQPNFGLLDTDGSDTVFLLRLPPLNPVDIESVELSIIVNIPASGSEGVLHLARVGTAGLCDWMPGTQQGGALPNGATWNQCDPGAGQSWPGETIFDALLDPLDGIGLSELAAGGNDEEVIFIVPVDVLEPGGTTLLVYTEDVSNSVAVVFSADSGSGPVVYFQGCV